MWRWSTPVDDKAKPWVRYADRERAENVAAMMRKHDILQVRRMDDEREAHEHNGKRRPFLLWAPHAEFALPERLTERIVAKVESQAPAS